MAKAKCINFQCSEIGKVVEVENPTITTQPRCKKCGEDLIVSNPIGVKKYVISGVVALLLIGGGGLAYNQGWFDSSKEEIQDKNVTENIDNSTKKKKEKNNTIAVSNVERKPTKPTPPPPVPAKSIMQICGSNLVNHEVIPTLAIKFLTDKGYTNVHKELTNDEHTVRIVGNRGDTKEYIEILSDGSIKGYDDLLNQSCDLATSYGEMSKTIAKNFKFIIKTKAYESPFALDAIAIVVHANNPIKSLTPHQLRRVFSGQITNWSEVTNGQKQGEILLYGMSKDSGVYHEFVKDLKPQKGGFQINSSTKSFVKHEDLEAEVALQPDAIGFVSNAHTTNNIKVVPLREGDSLLSPNPATILSEEYDLFDELYLYSSSDSNRLSMKFKAYLNSDDIQKWISENSKLVAMNIITKEESLEMEQHQKQKRLDNPLIPQSYRDYMSTRIQTPVVFYFDTGKSDLDHEAYKHILQLKSVLKKYQGATISLIGFSDSGKYRGLTPLQDQQAKIDLSKERANRVKSVLEPIFPKLAIETRGFGGDEHLLFAPHADSVHERKLDRRVEVWLKIDR